LTRWIWDSSDQAIAIRSIVCGVGASRGGKTEIEWEGDQDAVAAPRPSHTHLVFRLKSNDRWCPRLRRRKAKAAGQDHKRWAHLCFVNEVPFPVGASFQKVADCAILPKDIEIGSRQGWLPWPVILLSESREPVASERIWQ
jgi:hypothetical protein